MSYIEYLKSRRGTFLILLAALSLLPQASQAVPSFARQTGLACAACHTTYPELTAFGRNFKLNGYTMTGNQQIESASTGNEAGVKINQVLPLSAMLTASFTQLGKSAPGTQNGDVALPQEFSIFFAGEITPHIGSFVQVTYEQESGDFGFDNTDIRYANHATVAGADTLYGITLNNGPTVEDPWNSTPAWGFPFASSPVAPEPAASPLIVSLGQDVAGIGGYGLWNSHLYANVSLYRSAHQGNFPPDSSSEMTIKDVSPYWRLAWQQNIGSDYLEIGTFGMQSKIYPDGISGLIDKYTDTAVDAQYEHIMSDDMLTLRGSYIHEQQDLSRSFTDGVSANPSNSLDTLNLNGTFHWGTRAAFSLGYFSISGDSDTGLYAPGPVDGSATGSPDTRGYILQASYLPWQNTQFSLQYTGYSEFNGSSSNYDGSGRDASDNDALFLHAWLVW
jgi:hypothetical protein